MSDLIALYDRIAQALRAEDDSVTLQFFTQDFVVHEDPGMPYGGVFHGPDKFIALRRKVRKIWNLQFIAKCAEPDGRTMVAVFKATGVPGGLADSLEAFVNVVWTFRGDMASEARVFYYDTPRLAAALAAREGARLTQ
jgi:hypothetical protein